MKLVTVPLDNRPVTSLYPQQIAGLGGVSCLSPPRQLLASLTEPSDPELALAWLEDILAKESPEHAVLCLDALLYGGLINSRRCPEDINVIKQRLKDLSRLKKIAGNTTIHCQTSIMRISDNYDPTEEKPYWSQYGREIFEWSALLHRLLNGQLKDLGQIVSIEARIPPEIRADYLATRRRNFQINMALIQSVAKNSIDYLAISLDDSGQLGLNVHEKNRLAVASKHNALSDRIAIYAGADEVSSVLIARCLTLSLNARPKACVTYNHISAAKAISLYEGQPIEKSVESQLAVARTEIADRERADFQVIIHAAPDRQGDHIRLPEKPDLTGLETQSSVEATMKLLCQSDLPVVLCDLAYANGADPNLIAELLKQPELLHKLWGYAGWNTSGNSIGSAVATGTAAWAAARSGSGSFGRKLRECLFVRLADDWAYQAMVRKELAGKPDHERLMQLMTPYLSQLEGALELESVQPSLSFPWNRTFEVCITL